MTASGDRLVEAWAVAEAWTILLTAAERAHAAAVEASAAADAAVAAHSAAHDSEDAKELDLARAALTLAEDAYRAVENGSDSEAKRAAIAALSAARREYELTASLHACGDVPHTEAAKAAATVFMAAASNEIVEDDEAIEFVENNYGFNYAVQEAGSFVEATELDRQRTCDQAEKARAAVERERAGSADGDAAAQKRIEELDSEAWDWEEEAWHDEATAAGTAFAAEAAAASEAKVAAAGDVARHAAAAVRSADAYREAVAAAHRAAIAGAYAAAEVYAINKKAYEASCSSWRPEVSESAERAEAAARSAYLVGPAAIGEAHLDG